VLRLVCEELNVLLHLILVFLTAGCSWTLGGISEWKQDLWNSEAVGQHWGDFYNKFFADAEE